MIGLHTIRKERFEVISLAYNNFLNDMNDIKEGEKYAGHYSKERSLRGKEIDALYDYIQAETSGQLTFVIDIHNIVFYPAREFEKFLNLKARRIVFYDVAVDNILPKLKEDLQDSFLEGTSDEGLSLLFSNCPTKEAYEREIKDRMRQIYQDESARIVKSLAKPMMRRKPLESSGIYSSCYVNIKELFTKPDDYNFIIFQMVGKIAEGGEKIDALVSTSRNGAVLANILGWLLDKKVVHCTSLGPKYAIETDTIMKEIRKGKKYLYVFDFICLGTEIKVLNALLGVRDAELVGGIGIANYIPLDSKYAQGNVLGRMTSLVSIMEYKIPYVVAGTLEDLEILKKARENSGKAEKGV